MLIVCYLIVHVTCMECTRGHRESMNAYVRRESMERLTGGGEVLRSGGRGKGR